MANLPPTADVTEPRSTARYSPPWKRRRRLLWTVAIGFAAGVVALLLILITVGVLVLPGASPPAQVTVTGIDYYIIQETNGSTGSGWFGPSYFNYSGINGFPFKVDPGASFTVPLVLTNLDNQNQTIYFALAAPPFKCVSSIPTMPTEVSAFGLVNSEVSFIFSLVAPPNPGASLVLNMTISALVPPPGQALGCAG